MKLFILMLLMLNTYVAIANDRIESSVVLSNSISMERREILKKVFERLESIEFNPETLSSSYKKMYGKNKDGLINYLKKRAKYILDENDAIAYRPAFGRPDAVNLGTALWFSALSAGYEENTRNFNGKLININSTRVGMIQLNESFFRFPVIKQISTLLHEARHSDCDEKITFPFEKQNLQECRYPHASGNGVSRDADQNPWGAYAAEYLFGEAVANSCINCDDDERWNGLIIWSDTQSRIKLKEMDNSDDKDTLNH